MNYRIMDFWMSGIILENLLISILLFSYFILENYHILCDRKRFIGSPHPELVKL